MTCDLALIATTRLKTKRIVTFLRCFDELFRYPMDEIHAIDDKNLSQLLASYSSSLQSPSKSFKTEDTLTSSTTSIKQDRDKHFNQATLLLHEACESGDTANVQKVLSGGKANLNSLIGGHRTYRSALHKASAYGHTDTVKLLLKVSGEMLLENGIL